MIQKRFHILNCPCKGAHRNMTLRIEQKRQQSRRKKIALYLRICYVNNYQLSNFLYICLIFVSYSNYFHVDRVQSFLTILIISLISVLSPAKTLFLLDPLLFFVQMTSHNSISADVLQHIYLAEDPTRSTEFSRS